MPIPGSPEWHARLQQMLAKEARQPEHWWYLSFAGEEGFRGACVVRARGSVSAILTAHELGINPGGEVMSIDVGDNPGPYPTNRLLSKADLGPGAKTVGELEDSGIPPGRGVEFHD